MDAFAPPSPCDALLDVGKDKTGNSNDVEEKPTHHVCPGAVHHLEARPKSKRFMALVAIAPTNLSSQVHWFTSKVF